MHIKSRLSKKAKLLAVVLASAAGSAMAAVPPAVQTSLDDGKADGLLIAGACLAVIVAIAVFKYVRRAL